MKYLSALVLFSFLGTVLFGQSAVNSGGTFQENNQGQHQFAIGGIMTNIQNEDGYVLGGIQQIILNAGNIEFPIDTTTVSLFHPDRNMLINIYPNPTGGKVNLDPENFSNLEYHLLNPEGKIIQNNTIDSDNYSLNMNKYPNGIYHLRITDKNTKESVTISIVKQ